MTTQTTPSSALRASFLTLLLALMGFSLTACGYNAIPTLDEQVNASWSQVQNEYQRRADLVPNLVQTVKGYAAHEKDTLTAVTDARARATSITMTPEMLNDPAAMQKFEQAQGQLTTALSHLMMVSEQYPNLKADQNFLALQSQLEGTENRIAVARRDYIQAVQQYNTAVRTFPTMIWAHFQHAQPKATFSAPEADQAVPKVQF
jgi:LemA protein